MALDERLMREVNELTKYLIDKMRSKDTHFLPSIAKCPLLSTRRDVSLMDEAFSEYLSKVMPICTPEKHTVKVGDIIVELPKLLRCGEVLILPKLMLLRDNVLSHIIEALLTSTILNTEIVLNYLSRHLNGDITEGISITIKPEWGRELLDAAIASLKEKPLALKTLNCNKCPLKKSCPYSYIGDEVVIPEKSKALVDDIIRQLTTEQKMEVNVQLISQEAAQQPQQFTQKFMAKPSPPTVINRESIRQYLHEVAQWAKEHGRVWTSIGVGICPICGREGVVVVRTRGNEAKVLYRHGKSTCTLGTIDESIDRLNITRFLEIVERE